MPETPAYPSGGSSSVTVPAVVARPTRFCPILASVNHSAPSAPAAMPDGLLSRVGVGNSVITPAVVMRPMLFVPASVNQSARSGPATNWIGLASTGNAKLVTSPDVAIRPMAGADFLVERTVNQTAPSGPVVMPAGELSGAGSGNSLCVPVAAQRSAVGKLVVVLDGPDEGKREGTAAGAARGRDAVVVVAGRASSVVSEEIGLDEPPDRALVSAPTAFTTRSRRLGCRWRVTSGDMAATSVSAASSAPHVTYRRRRTLWVGSAVVSAASSSLVGAISLQRPRCSTRVTDPCRTHSAGAGTRPAASGPRPASATRIVPNTASCIGYGVLDRRLDAGRSAGFVG